MAAHPLIPLAGAVFAGGKASRFGSDKTRLPVRGLSLASHLLTQMGLAGLSPLVLSGPGSPEDLPEGVRVLPDAVPGMGPLGALATVLEALQGPVLVAGGDMPGLDAEAFGALRAAWEPGQGGLVVQSAQGLEPLFAIYEPSLLPSLRQAIQAQELALHRWLQQQKLPLFKNVKPQWLVNINRPEDWERFDSK